MIQDFLDHLRTTNEDRLKAWTGDQQEAGAMFHAIELAGEVGELMNVIKKLKREEMGWRGSTASFDDLRNEMADVLICLDKLAAYYDICLTEVTINKFNATSDKMGLPQKLDGDRYG
jgi:NTP pyrophosphatase (non-canonical NTP hydrolase)